MAAIDRRPARLCSFLQDRLVSEVVVFLQAGLLAFHPVCSFLNDGVEVFSVAGEEAAGVALLAVGRTTTISGRFLDGTKTVVLEDTVFDREQNKYLPRRLTLSRSDRYGLPTSKDDDVLLTSPVAKRLYRFLDKRFYHSNRVEIDLLELGLRKVRLAVANNNAQIKRTLLKGIEELEHVWELKPCLPEDRFRKDRRGKLFVSPWATAQPFTVRQVLAAAMTLTTPCSLSLTAGGGFHRRGERQHAAAGGRCNFRDGAGPESHIRPSAMVDCDATTVDNSRV